MRRRQTCCMHGGYRGSGVTINWNTTSPNGVPIVKPTPSNPEPIDNIPPQNSNSKASRIGEIVGLTVSGIGAATLAGLGAYTYYKNSRGIIDEGDSRPPRQGRRISLWESPEEESRILSEEEGYPVMDLPLLKNQSALEAGDAADERDVLNKDWEFENL